MPEQIGALRAATGETRAVDHIGYSLLDRCDQCGNLGSVVLQVSVLDDGDLPNDVNHSRAQGTALAAVSLLTQYDHIGPVGAPCLHNIGGAVGRTVVDDDHLVVKFQGVKPFEHLANG